MELNGNFPVLIEEIDGEMRIVESPDELPIGMDFKIRAIRVVTVPLIQRILDASCCIPVGKEQYYQGYWAALKEIKQWLKDGHEKQSVSSKGRNNKT